MVKIPVVNYENCGFAFAQSVRYCQAALSTTYDDVVINITYGGSVVSNAISLGEMICLSSVRIRRPLKRMYEEDQTGNECY